MLKLSCRRTLFSISKACYERKWKQLIMNTPNLACMWWYNVPKPGILLHWIWGHTVSRVLKHIFQALDYSTASKHALRLYWLIIRTSVIPCGLPKRMQVELCLSFQHVGRMASKYCKHIISIFLFVATKGLKSKWNIIVTHQVCFTEPDMIVLSETYRFLRFIHRGKWVKIVL